MKVKELISVIFDRVVIYKSTNDGFENLYKGNIEDSPVDILEMNVESVGAKKKSIIDIHVF